MAAWWYYIANGGEHGPVLPEALKTLADHGMLSPGTLVRQHESSDWVPARRLSGLFTLPEPQPTSPDAAASGEPMIPFWPVAAAAPPAGLPAPSRWQFSIRQSLVSTALLGGACGTMSLAVRSFMKLHGATGLWFGLAATPVLLAGAVGVFTRKPMKWFLFGSIAGLFIASAIAPVAEYFVVVPILILAYTARTYGKKPVITWEQSIARRQKSIYRLSAICCVVLLLVWVPIIFIIPPGAGCRPMVQFLVTFVFILPATVVGIARAIRQLVETDSAEKLGMWAICAALLPVAVYAFTQWLILSAFGIIYED